MLVLLSSRRDPTFMGAALFVGMILAIAFCANSSLAQTPEELFSAGNTAYGNRLYDSAVLYYTAALETGNESSALYFNLANARFKTGDLGRAMVNYLKAERLDPSDDDIKHNLEFARQFSSVQMEGVELNPISSFVNAIVGPYRLTVWAWWSSLAFILLMLCLILRHGFSVTHVALRSGVTVLAVTVLILSTLTTWKYRAEFVDRRAVVIEESATVFTGPSASSDVELQAAPGLVVEIIGESGEFYNVLFANMRRGWMKSSQIEPI
jgi:tetratricopeptide (TPR) repeat protein